MLCVVDKPVLQYAVEEAKAAGIEEFVFVSSRGKTALEDHFDENAELYASLEARKKVEQLKAARDAELPPGQFSFVRQAQPLGLGHAVWCARHLVGNRPFAVLLPDEIFKCRTALLAQMVKAYGAHGGNLIAVREVPKAQTSRYGILAIGQDDGTVAEVTGLVEKPKPEEAPSDLSIVGRYILQPEVFSHLDRQERGAGGEIQLTDAMARLIGSQPFHGVRFEGDRFDCGDKVGFIAANLAYGLDRPDLSAALREAVSRYL
jgi:UTP--glucose-1-phosphate uridylyltransferase